MISKTAQKLLDTGLAQFGLVIDEHQMHQIHQYLKVLIQWNKTFNLTAIRDPDDMVVHHLLDSFAIQPFLKAHLLSGSTELGVFEGIAGGACLDLGSGAGVPGVPLAILNPSSQWILVDSNGKKTRFLGQVIRETQLKNVTVIHGRIENMQLDADLPRPLLITARALASAQAVLELVAPSVHPADRILLMKGVKGLDESKCVVDGFLPFEVHSIKVPFLDAERCLLSTEYVGTPEL